MPCYGNAAYQRQWVQNVLADVRDHGWDGVKVDNAQARRLSGDPNLTRVIRLGGECHLEPE